jgi:hypothetical protein
MPVMPQKLAGWRIEPPVSVPVAAGSRRAATAAAEPPDEPPGHARRVPGVVHRAVGRVLVGRAHRELVAVELAQRDRAGLRQARHHGGVEGAAVALEHLRAGGGRVAAGDEDVLVRQGTPSSGRAPRRHGGRRRRGPGASAPSASRMQEGAQRVGRGRASRPASTSTARHSPAPGALASSATPRVCRAGAHSITFGTRNRPSSTAGALALVGARSLLLGHGVLAQAQLHGCTADSGVYSGSTPLVSTALICSTMPKKPLSWPASPALGGLSSSRARCAMRLTSCGGQGHRPMGSAKETVVSGRPCENLSRVHPHGLLGIISRGAWVLSPACSPRPRPPKLRPCVGRP